ncbi:hypothetical protein GNY06_07575 [Elizabethkingia argentiflava]|uniref:Uncharacterized protein n=1 Tax=Elizabethkingia argenteiflava TaxID=2681556 RepID=A0A845PW88_9FLAO|nr:hypothetical protein [Elizabethkingia argenteiflava]NAW51241.1 hypothetical protein [Elizabethkingia argenteiflava]
MKKAFLFMLCGTIASFLFHHFLSGFGGEALNLYYAFAFGLGWGMAYFLDRIDFSLSKKLTFSFLGLMVLIILGIVFFNIEIAVPSVIRFSTVFVAYYLLASFKSSKSLRR